MDSPITRAEHEEFRRTVEAEMKALRDENHRITERLTELEGSAKEIQELALCVQRLAASMEAMCKTQEAQGASLSVLEGRDGEMWRKTLTYVLTALLGIVIGFCMTHIGISS